MNGEVLVSNVEMFQTACYRRVDHGLQQAA